MEAIVGLIFWGILIALIVFAPGYFWWILLALILGAAFSS